MSSAARTRCRFPWSVVAFLICLYLRSASSVSFSLDFSKTGDPCGRELVCKGDASFGNAMIELTNIDTTPVAMVSQGRVWYGTPVPLWNAVTGEVASFTTVFSFSIKWMEGSSDWGDGMAFFLSRFSRDAVLDSNYGGGLLGLFSNGNYLDATEVVAVEFDTLLNNEWDSSGQHVGIDVNSIKSVAYTNTTTTILSNGNANKNLTSGFTMTATVHYDNGTKLLAAHLRIDDDTFYHVNATVDLKKILPEEMAIGFSAGTAMKKERHRVLSWTFNSTLEEKQKEAAPPSPSPGLGPTGTQQPSPVEAINSKPSLKPLVFIKVLVPVACVLIIAIVGGLLVCLRRRRRRPSETVEPNGSAAAEFGMRITGPRRYTYRELAAATDNFAERNKLGEGGFGSVYKGRLLNEHDDTDDGQGQLLVAIKRFSSGSSASQSQGRKEFEAEVRIISRLRHRNLVQLLGWSDSAKGLLLVYELVPEGSLDEHIHSRDKLLTWPERYNIILGLGSALRYLHLDWEQCVVHGDIKPRNIMLDSSHNTKLGDFGLARLVDHGAGPQTTGLIQGTVGYIDPEFVNTFQRSTQSDVYSFGIVLLEIVSGRLPSSRQEMPFMLPKWVWSLYNQDMTIEAADTRLRTNDDDDDSDERQMERALVVGLWCAHPDPVERPSMAQAMNVLQSEDAKLPVLSPQMYRQLAPPSFSVGDESGGASPHSSTSANGVRSSSETTGAGVAASPQ